MANEVYVRASDNYLVVDKDGVVRGMKGLVKAGSFGAGEVFIQGGELCWANGSGSGFRARLIDVGSTAEPSGSFWLTSAGEPRIANSGRVYTPWRNLFTNNVSGATLSVYSDASRTGLLFTVSPGATYTYTSHRATYYLRLIGSGAQPGQHDFSISNVGAGYTVVVSGTYVPGSPENYLCDCGDGPYIRYTNACSSWSGWCGGGNLGCSSGTCSVTCEGVDPHDYGASFRETSYKCRQVGHTPGSAGTFSGVGAVVS